MTTSDDGRPVDAEPDETAPDDTVTDETVSDETELVARRRGPVPPTLVLVAVVLALLAGVLVTRATGTWGPHDARAQTPPAQTRPVTSALLVCAAVPPGSDHTQTIVAAGAPTAGTGTLTLTQLAGRAPIATAPPGGNVLRYLTPVGRGGPMVVRATGDLARGLTDSVTTLVTGGTAPAPQSVTVPAGQTLTVPVGVTGPAPTALLVETTTRTDLVVGWVLAEQGSRGALLTGGPLPQTPLTTSVPGVAPDPATGYPGH